MLGRGFFVVVERRILDPTRRKDTMGRKLQFGLMLPHFGEYASVQACIEGAQQAAGLGFHSVWVRDHIVFEPHALEGSDKAYFEGLMMLAAIASVTEGLTFGTAMLISHRHPLHLAQLLATLSHLAKGRVVLGLGLGGFAREFAAVGRPTELRDRAVLAHTNAELCRRLWAGEKVSYKDDNFAFEDVELSPTPLQPIPIWGGGGTPASCRRAAEYCEGWMPARITLETFKKRMEYLRTLTQEASKPMVTTAVMPYTSVARSRVDAFTGIDVPGLIRSTNGIRQLLKPGSGEFATLADIEGVLLAGTPEDIVRDSLAYAEAGADHIVFDLRLRYADWHEQIELLGQEVLTALR